MALTVTKKELDEFMNGLAKENQLAELFSEVAVRTSDESLLYLKKVLAISVSLVLYMRNAFPFENFKSLPCTSHDENNENIVITLLSTQQSTCKFNVLNFTRNLRQVLEAIDKKHLEKLTLKISYTGKDRRETEEYFYFKFKYMDGVNLTISRNDDSKELTFPYKETKLLISETALLIRKIQSFCRTPMIPNNETCKVELAVSGTSDAPQPVIPSWTGKLAPPKGVKCDGEDFGEVDTGFHKIHSSVDVYKK